MPGVTTWDEASHILPDLGQYHFSDDPSSIEFSTPFGKGSLGQKARVSNPEKLGIESLMSGFPGIKDFILLYGTPCKVESWISFQQLSNIILVWPHVKILTMSPEFDRSDKRLGFYDSLEWLVIGSAKSNYCSESLSQDLFRLPWKGFASFTRYYP